MVRNSNGEVRWNVAILEGLLFTKTHRLGVRVVESDCNTVVDAVNGGTLPIALECLNDFYKTIKIKSQCCKKNINRNYFVKWSIILGALV